jgi:glycosyltransferase involved in cell wall biosynthesis
MNVRLGIYGVALAHSEILHVVGDGAAGGGATTVMQMAHGIAACGMRVTIASQAGSYLIQQALRAGYSVLELDFKKRRTTVSVAHALADYLRRAPGTLVHAHGARAGLAAAMVPMALRSAFIYTVHGFHFANKFAGVKHLAMVAERIIMQRATATVFVSSNDEDTARRARLLPKRAISQVIYNGGEPTETETEPSLFDIVFLGRLHFQKNPVILTEILQALAPLRPSLGIIGTGELEETVRALVNRARLCEQVSFLGELPHAQALRFLARAKLMLLPSRWEGLPISVIEAMHRGLPVVASDVPGTNELVVNGETGFLVPMTDVGAFVSRIGQLLTDEELRVRMGAHALARARSKFSCDGQIKAYAILYERTVAAVPRELR